MHKIYISVLSLMLFGLCSPGIAAEADVAETGQVVCYDINGNTIACLNTGQDGNLKAGVAWPNTRFVKATAGAEVNCVTDRLTGLMWTDSPIAAAGGWQSALDNAEASANCGHNDWRLPNILELESLLTQEQASSSWLMTQGFRTLIGTSYWTSTTVEGQRERAFSVNLSNNQIFNVDKSNTNFLTLFVRNVD